MLYLQAWPGNLVLYLQVCMAREPSAVSTGMAGGDKGIKGIMGVDSKCGSTMGR